MLKGHLWESKKRSKDKSVITHTQKNCYNLKACKKQNKLILILLFIVYSFYISIIQSHLSSQYTSHIDMLLFSETGYFCSAQAGLEFGSILTQSTAPIVHKAKPLPPIPQSQAPAPKSTKPSPCPQVFGTFFFLSFLFLPSSFQTFKDALSLRLFCCSCM